MKISEAVRNVPHCWRNPPKEVFSTSQLWPRGELASEGPGNHMHWLQRAETFRRLCLFKAGESLQLVSWNSQGLSPVLWGLRGCHFTGGTQQPSERQSYPQPSFSGPSPMQGTVLGASDMPLSSLLQTWVGALHR